MRSRIPDTPHKNLACTVCHENAADFTQHRHQKAANCRKCHSSHIEKDTHDAHLGISCQTCHLKGILPIRDAADNRLGWKMKKDLTDLSLSSIKWVSRLAKIHASAVIFRGTNLGAAAMVPPRQKHFVHALPHGHIFSERYAVSIAALVIFLFGMFLFLSVLLSGTMDRTSAARIPC